MKIDIKYHYRTGTHCWYCDREYATSVGQFVNSGRTLFKTKDHVMPRKHGGINNERNYIGCCSDCNTMKGMKKLKGFINHLLIQAKDHPMSKLIPTMIRRSWKLYNKFSKAGLIELK